MTLKDTIDILQDSRTWAEDYTLFERQGFSKKVYLDYKITSAQPRVYFNCNSDENLSFRIHDLEFGDDKEAMFWHMASQEHGEASFEGFTNRLRFFGRELRGYLSSPAWEERTGIFVRNGRIEKVRSWEQMIEYKSKSFSLLIHAIMELDKRRRERDSS